MAKRFVFRFEVLRRLRQQKLQECQRLVAERQRKIQAIETRIATMTQQLEAHGRHIRELITPDARTGPVDVTAVRLERHFSNYVRHNILSAQTSLGQQRRELAREQADLADAHKQVKVLDKLEEKQRSRHEKAAARKDRIEQDEVAAQFARLAGPATNLAD